MVSFTGDLNEMSTSTFLLSVQALLGDLTSSLSTENMTHRKFNNNSLIYGNRKALEKLLI
jgi:hypothetical protein